MDSGREGFGSLRPGLGVLRHLSILPRRQGRRGDAVRVVLRLAPAATADRPGPTTRRAQRRTNAVATPAPTTDERRRHAGPNNGRTPSPRRPQQRTNAVARRAGVVREPFVRSSGRWVPSTAARRGPPSPGVHSLGAVDARRNPPTGNLATVDRDPVKIVRLRGGSARTSEIVAFSGKKRVLAAVSSGRLVRARRGVYVLPAGPDAVRVAPPSAASFRTRPPPSSSASRR